MRARDDTVQTKRRCRSTIARYERAATCVCANGYDCVRGGKCAVCVCVCVCERECVSVEVGRASGERECMRYTPA